MLAQGMATPGPSATVPAAAYRRGVAQTPKLVSEGSGGEDRGGGGSQFGEQGQRHDKAAAL